MKIEAAALLADDGFAPDRHAHAFSLDMRYVGQSYTLSVECDPETAVWEDVRAAFGAIGYRRAGKYADGFARRRDPAQGMAGGNPPRDLEPRRAFLVQVVEINRIAVNGAVVMGRHVPFGGDVFGQYAPRRFADSDRFGSRHRADAPVQLVKGIGQRHQLATEGETIVLKLRHCEFPLSWPRLPAQHGR